MNDKQIFCWNKLAAGSETKAIWTFAINKVVPKFFLTTAHTKQCKND